jgi:hypothetical protein
MERQKAIAHILRRIRELCEVQSRSNEASPEQDAVLWEIRALSEQYKALIETKKPT